MPSTMAKLSGPLLWITLPHMISRHLSCLSENTEGGKHRALSPLEIRALRLQPCPRSAAHIPRPPALRDNTFQAHAARLPEDGDPVSGDRLNELDAVAHRLGFAG